MTFVKVYDSWHLINRKYEKYSCLIKRIHVTYNIFSWYKRAKICFPELETKENNYRKTWFLTTLWYSTCLLFLYVILISCFTLRRNQSVLWCSCMNIPICSFTTSLLVRTAINTSLILYAQTNFWALTVEERWG